MDPKIRFTGRKKPKPPEAKETADSSIKINGESFSNGDTIVNKGQTFKIKNITDKTVALNCTEGAYKNTKLVTFGTEGFKQRVRDGDLYKKNEAEELEVNTTTKIRTTIRK